MNKDKQLLKRAWLAYQGFDKAVSRSTPTQEEVDAKYSQLDSIMMEIWDYMGDEIAQKS